MSQISSDGITRENVVWMVQNMAWVSDDHRSTLLETVKKIPEDKLWEAVVMITKTQINLFKIQKDWDSQKKKLATCRQEDQEKKEDEIALHDLEQKLNSIN